MSILTFKELTALVIFLVALITGIFPFVKKIRRIAINASRSRNFNQAMSISFAKGVFLAVGLFDLLPTAAQIFSKHHLKEVLVYYITGSLLLCFSVMKYFDLRLKLQIEEVNPWVLTTFILSMHSLLEGIVLGLSIVPHLILLLAVAIILHKGLAAFALAINLIHSKLKPLTAWLIFNLFALMTPVGILLGKQVISNTDSFLLAGCNIMAATLLIYIALLHDLTANLSLATSKPSKNYLGLLLGTSLVAIVNWALT